MKKILSILAALSVLVTPITAEARHKHYDSHRYDYPYRHRNHNGAGNFLGGLAAGVIGTIIIQEATRDRNYNNYDRCQNVIVENLRTTRGSFFVTDGFSRNSRLDGQRFYPSRRICVDYGLGGSYLIHDVNNNGYYDYGDGYTVVDFTRDRSSYVWMNY